MESQRESSSGELGEMARTVVIRTRQGVDAERLVHWLRVNFQQGGAGDKGAQAPDEKCWVSGGNPLVNAEIKRLV